METLKYKVIKTEEQYKNYCDVLEELVTQEDLSQELHDEVELIRYLIEKWEQEHSAFYDADPIQLLATLMMERGLKAKDLVGILGVSKGLVSDILRYKKGLSKEIIRSLSKYFKVSQEAFNRKYELKIPKNNSLKYTTSNNMLNELDLN